MKHRRGKGNAKLAGSPQLDLFARPPHVSTSRPVLDRAEVHPAHTPNVVLSPPQRILADPLIAFVLAGSRGRGRPEKPLSVAAGEASDQRLLDVREAAKRLGLSKSTLDKMRCSGRGPKFIRATERAIRYDPADLQAFADERRRRSTSDIATLLAT